MQILTCGDKNTQGQGCSLDTGQGYVNMPECAMHDILHDLISALLPSQLARRSPRTSKNKKKQTVKFRDHSTSFNPSIPVKIQKKQTMHEHKLFMNSKNASAPYHVKVLETLLFRCFVFGHTINPSSFHIYLPPGEGQQWCRCILATCPKPSLSCQNSVP